MTLATEHGFSRWLAQATFLQGWLLVERGRRSRHNADGRGSDTERAGIGLARWNALFAALLAEAYRKTAAAKDSR